MNDDIRSAQFDQALETLLERRGPAAPEFRSLLEVALQLRELPRLEFKTRLRAEIERRTVMLAPVKLREGFRTVTPFLIVRDSAALIDFMERAFGAVTTHSVISPQGSHAEVRIGDSMVMIGGGESLPEKSTAALHMFVEDPDAVYQRALAAGGKSLGAVEDRPYGERSGFVEDPVGNYWYIGRRLGPRPIPEGYGTLTPYLHPKSARGLIEFLKKAFAAEEIAFYEHGGRVMHAAARVGDSMVEMGEADRGPAALYVYVDDPDEAYRNALAAGATSERPPADQPYGERNASVVDPFGNTWFPARTIGS